VKFIHKSVFFLFFLKGKRRMSYKVGRKQNRKVNIRKQEKKGRENAYEKEGSK
jgi:hypothetical protein